MTGFSPFYAANYQEILVKNKQCNLNFNLAETHGLKISEQAINLLKWMLELDPQKRPTAKEALNHAWFLEQMTEDEKKNHLVLQRKQANLLKAHEL